MPNIHDKVSCQSDMCAVVMHVLPAGGAFCLRTRSQTQPSSMCMMWTTAYPPTLTTMTLTAPSAPSACSASRTSCLAAESCHEGPETLWLITRWLSLQVTFPSEYSPLLDYSCLFLSIYIYIQGTYLPIYQLLYVDSFIKSSYLLVGCLPYGTLSISVLRPLCWKLDHAATWHFASRIM